jgi:hypothetical protein
MDRWEPLRVALAWRVTAGDDEFVARVRQDSQFGAPHVLAGCLAEELVTAGHILRLRQLYGPALAALAKLPCGGRLQLLAADLERWLQQLPQLPDFDLAKLHFEVTELRGRNETEARKHVALVDQCLRARLKLFKFADLREYLECRVNEAWAEIRQRFIANGEPRLGGAPVDRGVEGPARDMLRSEVTETMTIRHDGQLHQGTRVWKSVIVCWEDMVEARSPRLSSEFSGQIVSTDVPKGEAPGREPLGPAIHAADYNIFPNGPPKGMPVAARRSRIRDHLKKEHGITGVSDRTFQRYGIKRNTRKSGANR